jgi:ketosteroid isomerase-like protein
LARSNAEIARESLAMWSSGDLEGTLATISPQIEWYAVFELPDLPPGKDVYRGRDEVRGLWKAFRSVWDEITIELDEVLHDADKVLVAEAHFHARGGASGIELDRRIFYVFELDGELLRRLRQFETADEALGAAGVNP